MAYKRIYLIPLSVSIILPITLAVTYGVAVYKGHVEALFPFINQAGSLPPESCIFSQGINLSSALVLIAIYIKFRQIAEFPIVDEENCISFNMNIFTCAIGIISCIGLNVLANFQESNVLTVHLIGVYTFHIFGMIYFVMQVYIAYQMPELGPWSASVMRLLISVFCFLLVLLVTICDAISHKQFKGNHTRENFRHWSRKDGGWELHLVATFGQWSLTLGFCLLFLTFVPEFKRIAIEEPVITLRHGDEHEAKPSVDDSEIELENAPAEEQT